MYIACQVRETDLDDFFMHENQPFPPSLSDCGNLRLGTKSVLAQCLEDLVQSTDDQQCGQPQVDMIVIDGAAIVNIIKPSPSDTFDDYALKFMEYIQKQFTGSVCRVDIIFDVYKFDSLKSATRKKRGKGIRVRVEGPKRIPKNWPEFLRDNNNKTELFDLLSKKVANKTFPGKVIITYEEHVYCSEKVDLRPLAPCTHEEADTRMLLHAANGSGEGCKKIMIKTVDTDVLVLAVSFAEKLSCEYLWVAFGTGKAFRYINVVSVAQKLGRDKCLALPAFHALTGCDTTSSFAGRGKRTAWAT